MKEKIGKMDFSKIKNLSSFKDTVKRWKDKSHRPEENTGKTQGHTAPPLSLDRWTVLASAWRAYHHEGKGPGEGAVSGRPQSSSGEMKDC